MKRRITRILATTLVIIVFILSVYTNKVVDHDYEPLYDKDGIFFHDLKIDNLYGETLLKYEDDKYYSILGTDVSEFQNIEDFSILKKSGIEFVYIRVGYRGYQSGLLFTDKRFESNYNKAKEAGLKIGVYFVSSATDSLEVKEEIDFVIKKLQNKEIDLPVALDLEEIYYDTARTDDMTNEDIMNVISTWFEYLNEYEKDGILYCGRFYIEEHLVQKELAQYPLWLAQYNDFPDYEYPFEIWQYTDSAEVSGIDTKLDLNLMIKAK